jgi:hypothetical protein
MKPALVLLNISAFFNALLTAREYHGYEDGYENSLPFSRGKGAGKKSRITYWRQDQIAILY